MLGHTIQYPGNFIILLLLTTFDVLIYKNSGEMEAKRQNKISRLIQKELGEILRKESKSLFNGALLSVTAVRVSPDLSFAKVYISIFSVDKTTDIIELVKKNAKIVRYNLGNAVKNQLRVVPELVFIQDDSLDYIENIENLLKQ
jgi:ribosome-binding factor A